MLHRYLRPKWHHSAPSRLFGDCGYRNNVVLCWARCQAWAFEAVELIKGKTDGRVVDFSKGTWQNRDEEALAVDTDERIVGYMYYM